MATPTPTPSGSPVGTTAYPFANVTPGASNLTQGDMPITAMPGPANIIYGHTYASSLAAGGSPDLVGWSFTAGTRAGTGLAGLQNLANYATQGGMNYYGLPGALEQWGQMTPDQRVALQKQLLASGMYSDAYYTTPSGRAAKQPLYGAVADPDTIQALSNAWSAAKVTGQTLDTVLGQHNDAARSAAQIYQQNTQVGIFDQSDPAELRGLADQQAVSVLGRKATAEEKLLAVSMVQAAQVQFQQGKFNQNVAANRADAAVQLAGGIGGTMGSGVAGGGSPATVNALVSALGGQESGSPTAGGYSAVNPQSGASGRFQIMPDNWSSWAQAAGLPANAPMTPQNQEIVARNQISLYLKDGNGDPAYVAVAWYAGEGAAKAFQADPTNPKWQKPQAGGNPSIASYAQSVTGKMAAAVPGSLATQSMAGQVGNLPADGSGGPGNAGSINVGQQPQTSGGPGNAGSINVGQWPTSAPGAIPTAGTSLAGERGSIGAVAGTGSGLTGVNTAQAGQVPTGTVTGGLPTPAQLLPTSTGVYTQVNPQADITEMLRAQNPLGASARDLAEILDAVRTMFHG
jgi:hypothetical protein